MNILILGAGGIGSYYGARLISQGHKVTFIARGEHLKALQKSGLKLKHPKFSFNKAIKAVDIKQLEKIKLEKIDAIILTTKSTSTNQIAKELSVIFNKNKNLPFIISLQNGVENEDILCKYFPKNKIIGALTRKIGAHIIKPGVIEATGDVETIIGAISLDKDNKKFLEKFKSSLEEVDILCEIAFDIKLELWKKLIINNGVNAICALLEKKTGVIMGDKKLSQIVYGLMCETASAAKAANIKISQKDIDSMYQLIMHFDSIKPSMLVDREFKRPLEIDEICGVVIKNNQLQKLDSPYTKTISYLLEFVYRNN